MLLFPVLGARFAAAVAASSCTAGGGAGGAGAGGAAVVVALFTLCLCKLLSHSRPWSRKVTRNLQVFGQGNERDTWYNVL